MDRFAWRISPNNLSSLGELAVLANPLRGAVEPGTEPGLESTDYFGPQYGATASGTHAMILEVDPETMEIDIRKYVAVEDCGTILNELILEGQVHGGLSLGIGNCYYEKLVYDDSGNLLNGSFMDYLIPRATDMPKELIVGHQVTKSPLNPLGSKGGRRGGYHSGAISIRSGLGGCTGRLQPGDYRNAVEPEPAV